MYSPQSLEALQAYLKFGEGSNEASTEQKEPVTAEKMKEIKEQVDTQNQARSLMQILGSDGVNIKVKGKRFGYSASDAGVFHEPDLFDRLLYRPDEAAK